MIGKTAAVGDAEEEFNLEEVKFDESGANPSPSSDGHSEVVEATKASSTVALTSAVKKKRPHGTATEEREAKKDEFIEMCRFNLLSMQENADAERGQRREEQRADCKLMQMIGTSLASMAAFVTNVCDILFDSI